MIHNRSVPTDSMIPHLYYEDPATAAAWLSEAFGFTEHYRFELPDGRLHGVMMHFGDRWIMLKNANPHMVRPDRLGFSTQSLMIIVEAVDEHYAKATAAGARIVETLFETEYGERQYTALDTEGHVWMFAEHIRDVRPDSWGATMAQRQ